MSLEIEHKNYVYKDMDLSGLVPDPFIQFQKWLDEAIAFGIPEPYAMCLGTVGRDGRPSSRIVLLRGVNNEGFEFFTNYKSRKGEEMQNTPFVCLNFLWLAQARQVRVEGIVKKLSEAESTEYFDGRPDGNKLSAWASAQSSVIKSREELEKTFLDKEQLFKNKPIPKPDYWGGYVVIPEVFEFWQGRESRLHDRFRYSLQQNGGWKIERLAP